MGEKNDVDLYIEQFDEEVQYRLSSIRELGFSLIPDAEECLKYGIPTFLYNGNLVHYAGFKNHIGFYPDPTGITAFEEELKPYKQGKGTIRFPLDEPLPLDLIKRIIEYRIEENKKGKDPP